MKLFLSLVFCFLFANGNAQFHYKFNQFTTDDGLPTNSIYSITEDNFGNIVLGTDNGLTFFDGTEFKNLNVKDGLINPYIVSVYNDKNNVLWFSNYNGKLQKYENGKLSTTSVFTEYFNQIALISNKIFLYTIQNRKLNNTYNFSEYLVKNNTFLKLKSETKSIVIAPPILSQDNEIITVEHNTIFYRNHKVSLPKEVSFIHKIIFRKNDIAILDENYLFITDFNGVVVSKIKLPKPLSENAIYKYDFIKDQQEDLWLNIQSKGVFILKNNVWNNLNETLELNPEENTNFLYCDRKGKIWIATNENGLYCIQNTQVEAIKFKNDENYFNGFANSVDGKSLFISSKFRLYTYENSVLKLLEKSKLEIKIGNYNKMPILYKSANNPICFNPKLKLLTVSGKQILKKDGENYYIFSGNAGITVFEKNNPLGKPLVSKNPKNEKIKRILFHNGEYYFNNSEKINCRTFDSKQITEKRTLNFKIKGYIEDFIFHQDTMFIAVSNTIYKIKNEVLIDSLKEINHTKIGSVNKFVSLKNNLYMCRKRIIYSFKKCKSCAKQIQLFT